MSQHYRTKAKSRKYQGVFEVKSRGKTWQVRGIWSQQNLVLINRVLYQIQVTALLPFFLSILHLLLQLSKIMLLSTVKLLLAIVMSISFGPLKTLPRSSKSCDCVTFTVLKYLLSTFLLYTPHCHMI